MTEIYMQISLTNKFPLLANTHPFLFLCQRGPDTHTARELNLTANRNRIKMSLKDDEGSIEVKTLKVNKRSGYNVRIILIEIIQNIRIYLFERNINFINREKSRT